MKHYVYKIINVRSGSYYYGARSHVDPPKDDYMGSSSLLNMLYEKEGVNSFNKEVLHIVNTRKEADLLEHGYVKEALETEPHKCYNKRLPGITKT